MTAELEKRTGNLQEQANGQFATFAGRRMRSLISPINYTWPPERKTEQIF
jgi:hypothetical protein